MKSIVPYLLISLALTGAAVAGPVPTFVSPEKAACIEIQEWLTCHGPELSGIAVLVLGLAVLACLFGKKKGLKNA